MCRLLFFKTYLHLKDFRFSTLYPVVTLRFLHKELRVSLYLTRQKHVRRHDINYIHEKQLKLQKGCLI